MCVYIIGSGHNEYYQRIKEEACWWRMVSGGSRRPWAEHRKQKRKNKGNRK